MEQRKITDDLQALLSVLPPVVAQAVTQANDSDNLLEIILDLGRLPTARFVDREVVLHNIDVTRADIDYVVTRIGDIDTDNRAGLERTLHRISAIRNRRGVIVGLTCRVGRAVYGTTNIIQDLIESGKSLLILGRPGVGKTTMLRESARILADLKRVVIVDTSNEIGGDGDVPHPAVGRARRMQVARPNLQHEVMIEAVENHNPEAIVIDEIGRELEAAAARTIAERGVQLIGTAHGNSLENLLLNPTLSDLVGGIESVTLSDEEARRRGTQKTVLERRSPPTFDVLIEIQTRDRLAVHPDVGLAVDTFLRGYPTPPEIRSRDEKGAIRIEREAPPARPMAGSASAGGTARFRPQAVDGPPRDRYGERPPRLGDYPAPGALPLGEPRGVSRPVSPATEDSYQPRGRASAQLTRIYPYGVARNRLMQAAKRVGVPVLIVNDPNEANVLVTLRSYYRKRQRTIIDAENRGIPIYVLRANTVNQMQQFLGELFDITLDSSAYIETDDLPQNYETPALKETQAAINAVLNGERWVELQPAASTIRRVQHEMARQANLLSHSYGKEPRRRVRIFKE
jgi:stage III sporulation protein SpoIIIAA